MMPPSQLKQDTTTVNGKPIIPPKQSIKDAPYKAAGNQKIGEPSDIVRQKGQTGTKSPADIAREKHIAAENFKKQQEAAMLKNKTSPNKNCSMIKNRSTGKVECKYY